MKRLMLIAVIPLLLCGLPAAADGPFFVDDLTVTTSRTFVAIQDSLASTTAKTAYVFAIGDEVEVVAWRYEISSSAREWVRVLPNPTNAFSDSVMTIPVGWTAPIDGQFDALTIRGTTSGGAVQVHCYK